MRLQKLVYRARFIYEATREIAIFFLRFYQLCIYGTRLISGKMKFDRQSRDFFRLLRVLEIDLSRQGRLVA